MFKRDLRLTPLAVLTGFALNAPLNLSCHSNGTALKISTNLGTPLSLYLAPYLPRRVLRFTSCGEEDWREVMRSRTMEVQARR